MQPVIHLMVGLPRSGKSTLAKTLGYPVVSGDAVRMALYGHRYILELEPLVVGLTHFIVRALIYSGHNNVVVDDCHITRESRDRWLSREWTVRYKPVPTPEEECVSRALSMGDREIIPVIRRMACEYQPPGEDMEEGCEKNKNSVV